MASTQFTRTQILLLIVVGLLSCMVVAMCVFIFGLFAFRPRLAQAQPTVTPLQQATITPVPVSDSSWDRVVERGKLIVGVSADYPPFEYYTDDFQLDGFDVALLREIGNRLGVQVEFRDMAFDGLANAASLGEIDVAASAISVTPERQGKFYFSNVYLVSQDGLLANQDSAITSITTIGDLSDKIVGVQSGSVYENWLRSNLVDEGKLPEANLRTYTLIDQAIIDLREGRLDLVALDSLPAESYVQQGGVKLVGKDLNSQRYAVGMPYGAGALRAQINNALTQIQNDGLLDELTRKYLDLAHSDVIPLPTPAPTQPPLPPTATPANYCLDGMALVGHVTYPDNNMTSPVSILPGSPFEKTWRIRNTGTCTWNSSYILAYANGNTLSSSMGGAATPIIGSVAPGAEYDITVNMVAPLFPGVYQGFWQLNNTAGSPFGDRLSVGIAVPSMDPATPSPPPGAPFIQRFTVYPEQISIGGCVQVQWLVTGSLVRVRIANNLRVLWDGAPAQGNLQDCLQTPGQYVYQISAEGPGGIIVTATDIVTVVNTLLPTLPAGNPPVVTAFSATPPDVKTGQCFTLSWSVDGDVNRIQLYRNNALLQDGLPFNGQVQDCPSAVGQVTYRIVASNAFGQVDMEERVVNVVSLLPGSRAFGLAVADWF